MHTIPNYLEIRGQLWGSSSLLPPRGFPGWHSCCPACAINAFTIGAISPAPMNYFLKRHFFLSLPEYTRDVCTLPIIWNMKKKFKGKLKCPGNNLLKPVLVLEFNFNKNVTSFYNRQLEPSHSESHQGEPAQC